MIQAALLIFIAIATHTHVQSFTTTSNINLSKKPISARGRRAQNTKKTYPRLRATKLGYIDDMTDSSSLLDGLLEKM